MRKPSFETLLAVGAALLAAASSAQEFPSQTRGTSANTAFQVGDIDTVNLFNGNLSLAIPIGPRYPVGGNLSYGLTLTYNSNIWDFEDDTCLGTQGGQGTTVRFQFAEPDPENNAGLGWNLTLGHLTEGSYVSPDGGRHRLFAELHPDTPQTPGVYYSNDGTYLRAKDAPSSCPAPPPGVTGSCWTIEFPDGTEHAFFNVGTAQAPNWRPTLLRDRYGNSIEVSYGDHDWTLTDSLGRRQVVRFDLSDAPRTWQKVASVDLSAFDPDPGSGNDRAIYHFSYEAPRIERHRYFDMLPEVPCIDPPPVLTDPMVGVDLLTQIRQPDGSFYRMVHDHSETLHVGYVPGSKSGALRELRIPTGALYRWDYDNLSYIFFYEIPAGFEAERFGANANYGVVKKEIFDDDGETSLGRWLYEPDQGPFGSGPDDPPCYSTNKVTDSVGNWTVHYFHLRRPEHLNGAPFTVCAPGSGDPASPLAGPYLSQEVFENDGSTNGWKRRSVWLEFDDEGPLANGGRGAEIRYPWRRTVFHDDNDYVVEVSRSDHDGLGHYRREVLTSTFPEGRNTRTTLTRYNPASGTLGTPSFQLPPIDEPWILNTYDLIQVTEGEASDGHRATTQFCFEAATGFLQGRRQLNPAGGANSDVLTLFSRDARGNQTAERTWGGDLEPQANLPGGCSAAPSAAPQFHLSNTYSGGVLATTSFLDGNGNVFLRTVDNTIDVPSGLVRSSRDPSGFETRFTYDSMGRILTAVPDEGAWTQHVYTYPRLSAPDRELEYEVRQCAEGAAGCQAPGNQLTRERVLYDRLARQIQEWRQLPTEVGSDEVSRTFAYDDLGRRTLLTQWGRPSAATRFLDFDRFGRPGEIRRPDDSRTRFGYTGSRVVRRETLAPGNSQTVEATIEEVRDAKGRRVRVREQSGAGGDFVDTTYAYDEGDRLIEVCSNEIAGSCGQIRAFDYDDRGFLRSEQHPEIGANGNGTYRYTYTARGDLLERSLAGSNAFTQRLSYDPAGRVVQVRDGNHRLLKEFFFGRENGAGPLDRRKGKLVQAKRHNYVQASAAATTGSDIVVTEHFFYRQQAGRLSHYRLRGSGGAGFETEIQSYDDLGKIARLGYPACLYNFCSDSGRMELAKAYRYGALVGISDFLSDVAYHPNGQIAKIAHVNGVTDFRDQPATGWPRLDRIRTTIGGAPLRDSGTYSYDGSGNITNIGAERYFYDRVNRLIEGRVDAGGPQLLTRRYAYDAYGNLTSVTGAGNPVGALSPSSATNRLGSGHATYDAAGNVNRLAIGFDYSFDPFNQMKSLEGGNVQRSFLYNADDERVAILDLASGSDRQIWTPRGPDNRVLSRFLLADGSLDREKDYVHADNLQVATVQAGGAKRHLHADHLGSTRMVTGPGGGEVSSFTYYPFGENVADPGPGAEELQFTGHERDDNGAGAGGDLDYMHARYGAFHFGRFLSPDPKLGAVADPQSWNRFSYAGNDPIRFVDPDGRAKRIKLAGPLDLEVDFSLAIKAWKFFEIAISIDKEEAVKPDTPYFLNKRGIVRELPAEMKEVKSTVTIKFLAGVPTFKNALPGFRSADGHVHPAILSQAGFGATFSNTSRVRTATNLVGDRFVRDSDPFAEFGFKGFKAKGGATILQFLFFGLVLDEPEEFNGLGEYPEVQPSSEDESGN